MRQEFALRFLHTHETHRINKKINSLIQKHTDNYFKNIIPIQYHSPFSFRPKKEDKINISNTDDSPASYSHLTNSKVEIEIKIELILLYQ